MGLNMIIGGSFIVRPLHHSHEVGNPPAKGMIPALRLKYATIIDFQGCYRGLRNCPQLGLQPTHSFPNWLYMLSPNYR